MALDKVEQKKSLCGVELQYGRNKDNVKKTKKNWQHNFVQVDMMGMCRERANILRERQNMVRSCNEQATG